MDAHHSIIFIVSGQGSISADHQLMYAGDFEAQVRLTFGNLRAVWDRWGFLLMMS